MSQKSNDYTIEYFKGVAYRSYKTHSNQETPHKSKEKADYDYCGGCGRWAYGGLCHDCYENLREYEQALEAEREYYNVRSN